jgi:hypothetical protein
VNVREAMLRIALAVSGTIGYGCLAAFLCLTTLQIYRWFRQGEWTHIGVSDGLLTILGRCCVRDGETSRMAGFTHWLATPVDWLGLHKLLEVMPASLALFALSIAGNCMLNYCKDRLERR